MTKNRQLTTYEAIRYYDGYDLDVTANTQNPEGTYVFHARQAETEFNTSASLNSNGEIEEILSSEPSELTVNVAALRSILQNKQLSRRIPRSSEMSLGAPAKMLANE